MAEENIDEKSDLRNRNRRGMSTFAMIRDWFSEVWFSFTSSFNTGRRRGNVSPKTSDSSRSSSRKAKNRSGKLSITRPVIEKELIETSKRKYQSHLLVVGLAGAGKSRIIEQLMSQQLQKLPSDVPFITEIEAEKLTIIEGPGMCTGSGFETDASTIVTIKQYLNQKLPIQIPNAILIVARFDDNRFEGEGSDFTRMLNGIKCLRKCLSDAGLTNAILVLTFKDDSENVDFKLSRFRKTFDNIFPESYGIRIVTLKKNETNVSGLLTELIAVASEREDEHFKEALKLFKNSDYHRYPVALIPASEFLPAQNEIYKVMDKLNGSKSSDCESEEQSLEDSDHQKVHPIIIPYTKMHCSDNQVAQTWLRKGTLVRMADASEIEVDSIRVGDKLMNYKLKYDVVESVEMKTLQRWKGEERLTNGSVTPREPVMALIHCSYRERSSNDVRVLQYNRGRIRMMPYVEPIDPVLDDEIMFCIRMNKLDGTYIADNCVFKHRVPPYPESTRL